MKSPEYQSFELDKQAGDHLSKPQQAGTFRRFMDYLGLTQKEIEVLKKSDLHFDDQSKEVFSGIVDGHILEGIGSGEGRRDGMTLTKEEETKINDELYGIAEMIDHSQEESEKTWKTSENSPESPV